MLLLLVVIGETFSWGGTGSLFGELPSVWHREAVDTAASEFAPRERRPDRAGTNDPQAWQREREQGAEIDRERSDQARGPGAR